MVNYSKLRYVPNIVNTEKYKYLANETIFKTNKFKPYIICLGNIHERKNYTLAIKAFYEVQKIYPLKLIRRSTFEKEYRVLTNLINKLNLKSK